MSKSRNSKYYKDYEYDDYQDRKKHIDDRRHRKQAKHRDRMKNLEIDDEVPNEYTPRKAY